MNLLFVPGHIVLVEKKSKCLTLFIYFKLYRSRLQCWLCCIRCFCLYFLLYKCIIHSAYFYSCYYCSLKLTFNKKRQICAYCRTSGIHHANQVKVLLAVETQAGSGCSVPNHTVLYWPVPLSGNASWIRMFCPESYRTVLTRTAQWKRKLDQDVLSRIIPYCTDPCRSVETQAGSGCSVPNHTVLYWPVPLSGNASWIRMFCPESYRTVPTRTAQWKRKLDQDVLSRIIPYCTDPYRSVETQAGSGCSVPNHTVLYRPVPLSGNASWIRVFCPESYRTVPTRTAQWKRKLDQGVLSRIIPYCTDPYRSVETQAGSGCSVPNHTVLYWPVPLSGNASWIRVFCPESYRTVLTRTAQWKRKLDQGVLSRIIPYCTDPYRSVETQAGSGCSVPNHTVLYWPVPLSGNASWIRVFCPESYRTVLTRTAQWKRKLDQGVLSRIIPYCTDPYRSVETQAGSGCSVPNHTVLYWPVPLSGNQPKVSSLIFIMVWVRHHRMQK